MSGTTINLNKLKELVHHTVGDEGKYTTLDFVKTLKPDSSGNMDLKNIGYNNLNQLRAINFVEKAEENNKEYNEHRDNFMASTLMGGYISGGAYLISHALLVFTKRGEIILNRLEKFKLFKNFKSFPQMLLTGGITTITGAFIGAYRVKDEAKAAKQAIENDPYRKTAFDLQEALSNTY